MVSSHHRRKPRWSWRARRRSAMYTVPLEANRKRLNRIVRGTSRSCGPGLPVDLRRNSMKATISAPKKVASEKMNDRMPSVGGWIRSTTLVERGGSAASTDACCSSYSGRGDVIGGSLTKLWAGGGDDVAHS